MAPPFHLKRKKESLWCPAQAASALLRENLCQQWPLERTNWYLWHQPVLPKTKVSVNLQKFQAQRSAIFHASWLQGSTVKQRLMFSSSNTPLLSLQRCEQHKTEKSSHLLSNNFVREKRLTDSISSLVFQSMALGLRSPHPDINFFLPLNNTKVIISW